MSPEPGSSLAYVCPRCLSALASDDEGARCVACGRRFPLEPYPDFLPDVEPTPDHRGVNVHGEDRGMVFKAGQFYGPELQQLGPLDQLRVLDDGCGTGRLVDELARAGVDAWGVDPSASEQRLEEWGTRTERHRLARADGLALPFADGFFDAVFSNGVLEHIGEFRPDRTVLRQRYVSEALRVLKPGGRLLLGHPNGACPLDFWHGGFHSIRPHRPYEAWMPHFGEVRRYVEAADPGATLEPLSPRSYNSFERAAGSPLGRALTPAARAVISLVDRFPRLRTSPLNPQLVVRITRSAAPSAVARVSG